jgi:Zn-dependent protease with chaperone function
VTVRLRAGLGVVLLVGFFVLLLALTGGLVAAAIYTLATGHTIGVKLGIAAVVVVIAVGSALRKVLAVRAEPHGAVVSRTEQPELWQMIDELAVAANTRGPDEVRIVPEVNASVWEDSGLLGLRSGRRYMEVGLPLLGGMSAGELRSVLGHELGHYSHGHTKLSALTYRTTIAMRHTVNELSGPLQWILARYAMLYLLVAKSANRAQELQADAVAVRAAGKASTRAALGKLPALSAAWQHYSKSYVSLVPRAGRTPELLMGFHSFLTNDERRKQLTDLQGELLDAEPASRYDSHPPIRARIAAIDAMQEPDQAADDRPAWSLLGEPGSAVPQLESELLIDGLGPRASWEEIIRVAGAAVAKHNADELVEMAKKSGASTGSLNEILDVLQRGEGARLLAGMVDKLTGRERQEAIQEALTDLVGAVITTRLIEGGTANYELDWGGPWRLRTSAGELLDVSEHVAPAVADPAQVPALRAWIAGNVV